MEAVDDEWVTITRPGPFGDTGTVLDENALRSAATVSAVPLPVEALSFAPRLGSEVHLPDALGWILALRWDGSLQAKVAWVDGHGSPEEKRNLRPRALMKDARDQGTGEVHPWALVSATCDRAWVDGVYIGPPCRSTTAEAWDESDA